MRDALGNKITEGNLIHWRLPRDIAEGGLVFRVVRVLEPKLAVVGGEPPQPVLSLQLDIPINAEKGREPALAQFMRIVDPRQEAALEALTAKGDGTIQRPQ